MREGIGMVHQELMLIRPTRCGRTVVSGLRLPSTLQAEARARVESR